MPSSSLTPITLPTPLAACTPFSPLTLSTPLKSCGHLNLLTPLTAFTPFTYHIPLTSLLFHYSPYSFNIMHCLQSLHSPDSTLLRFLPLLFLLVWHPILYLITFSLDFPVLLLNPGTILTPFTPLTACTQFTSHIPLTSLHSRSFPSSFGILYPF